MISSECPGWVCYAEKRVGDLALPHMSTTKSPQQLFGVLSRLWYQHVNPTNVSLSHANDLLQSKKVKTVTLMPCYDKKLEAVRPDFIYGTEETKENHPKEVDTVLATHELLELFKLRGIQFD